MRNNNREMQKALEELRELLARKCTFLLVGRTGVGKSSTINSLLGQKVARVGHYEPTTVKVETFDAVIEGVQFSVIDTPGLCDGIDEKTDYRRIKEIFSKVSKIDCMLFVSELDAARVTGDEKRGIRLITESFGADVWKHAVIVFTFADRVSSETYTQRINKRTKLVQAEIRQHASLSEDFHIPAVAVANGHEKTPDGDPWLGKFYTQVAGRISQRAAVSFFMGTAPGLPEGALNEKQQGEVKVKVVSALAATGGALGMVFGPAGIFVGTGIGALFGFLVNWLRR